MFSGMAIAVIAGKIISGALAAPDLNNENTSSIAGAGAESPDDLQAANVVVIPPEAGANAKPDAGAASGLQSAPAPCDSAAVQLAPAPSALPPAQ